MATTPNTLSAREAAGLIRKGELTSAGLVGACLDRILARDAVIGAFEFIDPDAALAQARLCDANEPAGPLHGVPVAVKDVIDTADMPTGYGSPIYRDHRPGIDAECVAMLRRAGAVILGKTVSTEFAAITPGRTANPHNPAHTPGGSSSGSAAAVADRMAPLALGTQTVGSTIRPAAYCGVVGFKPSYGTFGLRGVLPQAPSLDTLGLFGRSVADIEILADVLMCGVGAFRGDTPDRPPRIGVCHTPHWPEAAPEAVAALEEARRQLEAAGCETGAADLPDAFADALDAQWTILKFEMARTLVYERDNHADGLSDGLRGIIDEGLNMPVDDWRGAQAILRCCRANIAAFFDRFDLLLTPSAASEAPEGLTTRTDLLFQRLWTALHLPCLTLPAFAGPKGLPVGIQLVGALGGDADLLTRAAWCEEVLVPAGPRMPA